MRYERRPVDGDLGVAREALERITREVRDVCAAVPVRESARARAARQNAADEARRAQDYLHGGEVAKGACHVAAALSWADVAMLGDRDWAEGVDRAAAGRCAGPLRAGLTLAWERIGALPGLATLAAAERHRVGARPCAEWARIAARIREQLKA